MGRKKITPARLYGNGVLMLSSILNSEKAIAINIKIGRIFTQIREMMLTHKDILMELESMRKTVEGQYERINLIHNYLIQYIDQQDEPRTAIGFRPGHEQA